MSSSAEYYMLIFVKFLIRSINWSYYWIVLCAQKNCRDFDKGNSIETSSLFVIVIFILVSKDWSCESLIEEQD
jgi:hypothetical protein